MHISNGTANTHNVTVETLHEQQERQENRTTAKHDEYMGDMPEWRDFVQHEYEMLANLKYIMSINALPENFVHDCFKKTTYVKSYSNLMCPMKESKEWPIAKQIKLLPPKARRMPGRPKKHRRREADEVGAGCKMSKKGIIMTCSRCLRIGHNKATCKADES
ncbi:hypothetical protein POM88_018621 [Heracleum sosnowskyi]|uniref:Uncharacterized protein n=1 Tax=Heracleum sosnowskyi TaxID=360622 RepID=A0AAD8ISP3_9APIA|nr:hypothetical protein POM88_018621 [Heracleum sosnowskyi]